MRFGGARRTQVLPTACRLLLANALLLISAAAAPGLVFGQEPERHETASWHQEAAGEQGDAHHHKNHVAFLAGFTEAEEHHGEKGDPDFTIGIDYERRLSKVFGVGVLADWVIDREYMIGVPLFLHAGKHVKFELAPAYRHVSHSGADDFVFRTGFLLDFPVGKVTISPGIFYDIAEGQDFLAVGIGIGRGF